MTIQNRVQELRQVKASELEHHPGNWRTHPKHQRNALRAMLHDVGNASAVIAYQHGDKLRIIDGHLRTDLAGDNEIPVIVLDVTEDEATKLLLTMDPIAAMAETNEQQLQQLLDQHPMPPGAEALETELRDLLEITETAVDDAEEPDIPVMFQVVAQCVDENAQRELYDRLTTDGYECRILTT